jgi:hypothetical protein
MIPFASMNTAAAYDDISNNSPLLKPITIDNLPSANGTLQQQPLSALDNEKRIFRQARKPSPGLAARLAALGFGKDKNLEQRQSSSPTQIGRIPEDQIRQLESIHQSNSAPSIIQRRGRAWSAASGRLTPQLTGGSYSSSMSADTRVTEDSSRERAISIASSVDKAMIGFEEVEDMDSHKYILPDHINTNGTKATLETREAHIQRPTPPDEEEILPPPMPEDPPPPLPKDSPPPLPKDPPPPLPKESPVMEQHPISPLPETPSAPDYTREVDSYFASNPFGLQRPGSIYTLSRVSFANQLAQLTSLQLPDAESLSSKVSAIPTSQAASRALMGAADQIRSWIQKASEVLGGLEADDDAEWAAAGGREGLEEVDNAIMRFEDLIHVYVGAIEELQNREDIASVSSDELTMVVTQVEAILTEWEKIRRTLKGVKNQVETAMEWEELWNVVLGDIGNELGILSRLVFEMEEKRHRTLMAETGDNVDIGELATIVEENPTPANRFHSNGNRLSVGQGFPATPASPGTPTLSQDDSSLLALFARMQPLRASLDFLPMRLSTFHARAQNVFPTAREELETRRHNLEKDWRRLEKDAESLRRELGEDRWVLVFRGAGRQAQKMYESVERSLSKLRDAIEAGNETQASLTKKIESYEAKKMHYGPAIDRVLSIIEKGVKDRLTVNGEVLRLQHDMTNKWDSLKVEMREVDEVVEEVQTEVRTQQLRDSISSMVSNDRSTVGSVMDTPNSSPASSVVMSGLNGGLETPGKNTRRTSGASRLPQARRYGSGSSIGSNQPQRKGLMSSRMSSYNHSSGRDSPLGRGESATPTGRSPARTPGYKIPRPAARPTIPINERPRWTSSVNVNDSVIGHGLSPLIRSTPSPYTRLPPPSNSARAVSASTESRIPLRSPRVRDAFSSPTGRSSPSKIRGSSVSRATPSPGPYSQQVLSASPSNRPRLASKSSTVGLRRQSMLASDAQNSSPLAKPALAIRPASSLATQRSASSMATGRRTSMLPTPEKPARGRPGSSLTGRMDSYSSAGSASAMRMRRASSNLSNDSRGSAGLPQWR